MDNQLSLFSRAGAFSSEAAPASPQRQARRKQQKPRKDQPTCTACGQRIVWVRTAKAGKPMPCDLAQEYGDGKKTLVTHDGRVIVKAGEHVLGRQPHFGTCPEWKKGQEAEEHTEETPVEVPPGVPAEAESSAETASGSAFYCPEHQYTPAPLSGFHFCPYCEEEACNDDTR